MLSSPKDFLGRSLGVGCLPARARAVSRGRWTAPMTPASRQACGSSRAQCGVPTGRKRGHSRVTPGPHVQWEQRSHELPQEYDHRSRRRYHSVIARPPAAHSSWRLPVRSSGCWQGGWSRRCNGRGRGRGCGRGSGQISGYGGREGRRLLQLLRPDPLLWEHWSGRVAVQMLRLLCK